MQTIETLKRSIKSAEDLAGVVRTMKTMAAVSIRQYETATESLDVYSQTIDTGLKMVLSRISGAGRNNVACDDTGTEKQNSTFGRTGAIIFGSDQGMCGQFNEQIAQYSVDSLSERTGARQQIAPALCIGHRVSDVVDSAGIHVKHIFRLPGSAVGITSLVQDLLPAIDQWREAHNIARILVYHNRRLSASTWRPYVMQLLPLRPERLRRQRDEDSQPASRSLPLWSMDSSVLFSRLVKQFLFVSLFRACAESLAGENASRIAAMQAAERNIKDRLQLLRSDYANRRQTTITEELLDVVTGFEALKQN